LFRSNIIVSLMSAVGIAAAQCPANCTELSPPPPTTPAISFVSGSEPPGNQFEVRFGAFAAGIGSAEQRTADLNASFLSPRLNVNLSNYAAYLLPRFQLGGAVNLEGRTSFAYTGIALTLPVGERLFFEPFVGGAIHNGSLTPAPGFSALGCPLLFHAGFSFGLAITEHWNAFATFEHLSNGKGFGVDCGTNQASSGSNQGLNNYGLSVGYAF
jgi:hypothetical protein